MRGIGRAGLAGLVVAVAVVSTLTLAAASSDDAIEKRVVLRAADFGPGWEKTSRRDPTRSDLDVCADIEDVNDALAAQSVRSPEFVRTDADNVLATNAVAVLKSAKRARAYLEPYRDPDAVRCLEDLTESSLTGAGFTAVGVYVTPTEPSPPGTDEAVGFEIEITVTAPTTAARPAVTAVIYQDVLVVRVGRALAAFTFLNPGKHLPESAELVDAVVGRLQDALG